MKLDDELKFKLYKKWKTRENEIFNGLALGILFFAKAYQENMGHPCSNEVLQFHFKIGKQRLTNALTLLRSKGFLLTTIIRDNKGRFLRSFNKYI